MRSDTHLAGGAVVAALGMALPEPYRWFFAVGALVGSLAPDSDIHNPLWKVAKKSSRLRYARMLFGGIIALFQIVALTVGFLLRSVAALFSISHRKEMHSFWIAVVLVVLFAPLAVFVSPEFAVGCGIGAGWLSHLILDSLTVSGLYWGKWHVSGPFKTGGTGDRVLGYILVGFAIVIALAMM